MNLKCWVQKSTYLCFLADPVFTTGKLSMKNLESVVIESSKIVNLPCVNLLQVNKVDHSEILNTIFNIWLLSRFVDNKRIDKVIDAINRLNVEAVHLNIGEVGPLKLALLKKVFIFGLFTKIIFHWFLNKAQLTNMYDCFNLFVQAPKKQGPFVLIILHGMVLGIPVVNNYKSGAAVERINHRYNGILLEDTTPESIANFFLNFDKHNRCYLKK